MKLSRCVLHEPRWHCHDHSFDPIFLKLKIWARRVTPYIQVALDNLCWAEVGRGRGGGCEPPARRLPSSHYVTADGWLPWRGRYRLRAKVWNDTGLSQVIAFAKQTKNGFANRPNCIKFVSYGSWLVEIDTLKLFLGQFWVMQLFESSLSQS